MKAPPSKSARGAFTLTELLAIIVTVFLIACCLTGFFVREHRMAPARNCANNQKKIGLAFKTWAIDGTDSYPMGLSTYSGGTKEIIDSGHVFIHFRALSNEFSMMQATPKLLVCPQDEAKVAATNFHSGFSDKNVSYFVGIDALDIYPQMFLSGDRNLAFNSQPLKPGLFVLTTNNPAISWTKAIHNACGNVAFADGSVQLLDSAQLTVAARNQEFATNRLAIP